MIKDSDIERWFTYHPPKGDAQIRKYAKLRDATKDLAQEFNHACPECPEKEQAMARLREAVMWLNAGIACNE